MFSKKFMRLFSCSTHNLLFSLFDSLIPPTCLSCGSITYHSGNICNPCLHDLPILPQSCQQCAQILPHSTSLHVKCGACLTKSPAFDFTHALFLYEAPIIQWVIKLKFQHQLCYAHTFGRLLTQQILLDWYVERPLPNLLIPIPLHHSRLQQRGFNQALEIAKPISRRLKIPIDIHGVRRIKATLAQSSLQASEREKNLKNAFKAFRNYQGLTIAVIDDVITTGQTVQECCRILKENGAKRIDVWCCARSKR